MDKSVLGTFEVAELRNIDFFVFVVLWVPGSLVRSKPDSFLSI